MTILPWPGSSPRARPGAGWHEPSPLYDDAEILHKVTARLSYKEIAEALVISPFTVKAHASNIYDKLSAAGRREALARARSLGLVAGA
jgi:DNA-binding CsgD family transcriptional regulator